MDSSAAIALASVATNLALVLFMYYPRHQRRDLAMSFMGINAGVLAVALALSHSTVGAGLGLGLFGVLSIIRLRSTELSQHEIAYYFAALALGLIGGLATPRPGMSYAGLAIIAIVIVISDLMFNASRQQHQQVVLDHALTNPEEIRSHLRESLGARIQRVRIVKVDLVDDTTIVDVISLPDDEAPRPVDMRPLIARRPARAERRVEVPSS